MFSDAVRPGDKANPVGLSFNIKGDVTHAHRQFPKQHSPHYPGVSGKVRNLGHSGTADIFKRQFTPTELFRMCHSKIALYQQPQEPSIETVTRETALHYQLHNKSFEEACVINAEVARRLGRHQVALTWTVLKTVYSVKSEARPVTGDLPATEPGALESGRLRTSSLGTRKLSSKVNNKVTNKVTSKVNNKANNKVNNKVTTIVDTNVSGGGGETSESEEEEEEEDQQDLAACHLADIASGYTIATITGDFFGDSELAGLGVDGLVSLEGGGSLGAGGAGSHQMLPDWSLPSEAFELKQEIKDGEREDDLLEGEGDAGGGEGAMQTVTVEDKTSAMVVPSMVHAQDTRPSWCPSTATREALTWLAEQGDVQNAVSMYLALAGGRNNTQDRVRDLIDNVTLEHWWLSYVDLLHRLQLFTKANEVKIYLREMFYSEISEDW